MTREEKIAEHLKINKISNSAKASKKLKNLKNEFIFIAHKYLDCFEDIEDVSKKVANTKVSFLSNENYITEDSFSAGWEQTFPVSAKGEFVSSHSIKIGLLDTDVLVAGNRNKIMSEVEYLKLYDKYKKLNKDEDVFAGEKLSIKERIENFITTRLNTPKQIIQKYEELEQDYLDKLNDEDYALLMQNIENEIEYNENFEPVQDRAETIKILAHEMGHLFAKTELVLFDKKGNEIPMEMLGTNQAGKGRLQIYYGGVPFESFPLLHNGQFKKYNGKIVSVDVLQYDALLHEGINEFITTKLVRSDALNELDKTNNIQKPEIREKLKTYNSFTDIVAMFDAINPQAFEKMHFKGKEYAKLENMEEEFYDNFEKMVDLESYLGKCYENYMFNLNNKALQKEITKFFGKIESMLEKDNAKVLKLFDNHKIGRNELKNYIKARNEFINNREWVECQEDLFDDDKTCFNQIKQIMHEKLNKFHIDCNKDFKEVYKNMAELEKNAESNKTLEDLKVRRKREKLIQSIETEAMVKNYFKKQKIESKDEMTK
ncbi:MAG: hypothetical protein IJW25_02930 [Clostridia bacterium]|nr:hypothetical protein [Clostridia bacterium]